MADATYAPIGSAQTSPSTAYIPELLTLKETAEILKLSYWSVHRLVRAGRLRAVYVSSRSPRVLAADLARLIDGLSPAASSSP